MRINKTVFIIFILILGYMLVKQSSKLTQLINSIFGGAVKGIKTFQGEGEYQSHE
jgi:hypothetical protein